MITLNCGYLGPCRVIDLAMMAKIIKENGQIFHMAMYQALTQDKWEQEECKAEHSSLMELLHQRLGPHAMVGDLADLTAEYAAV